MSQIKTLPVPPTRPLLWSLPCCWAQKNKNKKRTPASAFQVGLSSRMGCSSEEYIEGKCPPFWRLQVFAKWQHVLDLRKEEDPRLIKAEQKAETPPYSDWFSSNVGRKWYFNQFKGSQSHFKRKKLTHSEYACLKRLITSNFFDLGHWLEIKSKHRYSN